MSTNEELYEKAQEAITALFSDTSVSQEETWQNLDELAGEIQILQDSLQT